MTTLETITLTKEEEKQLEDAQSKVTLDMLDRLEFGEEVQLTEIFVLYHYCEDEVVVLNYSTNEEWEEVYQIQWNTETNEIVFEAL